MVLQIYVNATSLYPLYKIVRLAHLLLYVQVVPTTYSLSKKSIIYVTLVHNLILNVNNVQGKMYVLYVKQNIFLKLVLMVLRNVVYVQL